MKPNKYSYRYTHKTYNGKTLEIKDDVVYLDGKKAPVGYKWFDKNNNVTYRVQSDGTWLPIVDNRGRTLKRPSLMDKGKHRAFFEEDTHLDNISEEDKKPFDRLFELHHKTVKQRLNDEELFFIPMYLPGVKIANPKNSKLFKNVNIPYNALDSLYKWSGDKQRFIDALGLTRETSFMKFPSVKFDLSKEDLNRYLKRPEYNRILDPNRSFGYYPTDLVNNHHYYNNTPYSDETGALIKKGIINGTLPFANGQTNFFPYANEALSDEAQNRIQLDMKYLKQKPHYTNPITDAINYLYTNDYGMGPLYPKETRLIGIDLFNDPGLADWKLSRNIK